MIDLLRVLLIESSAEGTAHVVEELRALARVVESERIGDVAALRYALGNASWDAVICDGATPSSTVMGALRILRALNLDLPLILVSGAAGEETAVATRSGAHDYVFKDRLTGLKIALENELREGELRREGRQVLDTMRLGESRFRTLIENSTDAVVLSSADGKTIYASAAITRMLGYGPDALVGLDSAEFVHPEHRANLAEATRRVREEGLRSATVELQALHLDRSVLWLEATATNMLGDPDVGAIMVNIRDITDRKKALDALRGSETRYRMLIESTRQGAWVIDGEAKTLYMNARMTEMLGCAVGDRASPADYLDDLGRAVLSENLTDLRAGIARQAELNLVRTDGTRLWVLMEASPRLDASGRYEGAFAMFMDITERKNVEAAIAVSEARFRCLWDSGIVLVVISDREGRLKDINGAGVALLGYAHADLLEMSWSDIAPPAQQMFEARPSLGLRAEGVTPPFEQTVVRIGGETTQILTAAALLNEREVISVAIDLTERARVEAALEQTERQLRQAQKMEAVGRLAGGVAHDFNNLLSVVLSYGEMVFEGMREEDPARADVYEIVKAAKRAAALTSQLLMFSRRQVFEPRVLDPAEVLESMTHMLKRIVGEDVELAVVAQTGVGRLKADRSSIEQLVMNLVVNARDAMPTGGRLTVEASNAMLEAEFAREHLGIEPGRHVMISVTDSGVGMDKDTQARIFEPFFTTKPSGMGTGLGLSMVFGIARQSGGGVWVYSEPGHGTTFKVYLPCVDAALDALAPSEGPTTLRGNETILLVEDEDQVRVVASSILTRHGYRVIGARDAAEAVRLSEGYAGVIDLLVSDVVMPNTSGPQLARRMHAARPTMRVLCMSGYTDDSAVRHGVIDTEMAYLQKPLTPRSLTTKVREVLDAVLPTTPRTEPVQDPSVSV